MRSWRIKDNLAAHWPLQNAVGGVTPDVSGNGYPGTLVNAPTWGVGPFGGLQCIELDGGTQHVNVGDVTQLNAVEKFTLCGWLNQDVLDANDVFFLKQSHATLGNIRISIFGGDIYLEPISTTSNRGLFDYSTVISAMNWHHLAMVYDGSQVGNVARLVCYVDGIPVALTYQGTVPALSGDAAGADATIGGTVSSFDGRLWDWRLLTVATSRDEVNQIIHGPIPYLV